MRLGFDGADVQGEGASRGASSEFVVASRCGRMTMTTMPPMNIVMRIQVNSKRRGWNN